MFYDLPATLEAEIDELESLIEKYRQGLLDAAFLKVYRVPFGCYEQRRDGSYIVRIRAIGGAVTTGQLQAIAWLSGQYDAEAVHITSRQEFQIHDVALGNVIPAMRGLLNAGFSTRGGGNMVRNIILSPDAGIATDEVFDPSPYAFALTSLLITEPDSWALPRKLKIAFSNSPADTAFAQFNDIGYIATIVDGVKGFRVYVVGGLGAKSAVGHLLHEFIPAGEMYTVAKSINRLFDRRGNRKNKNAAWLRFLWKQLGEAKFRELYLAEFEAVSNEPSTSQFAPVEVLEETRFIPKRAIGDESIEFLTWKKRYAFEQRQTGLNSALIPVALGNIANQDLKELADFLSPFGENTVRATFGQNLRLRNIPEAFLPSVYAVAKTISGLADLPRVLDNSISCAGVDTCKLGICQPKGALAALENTLPTTSVDLNRLESFQISFPGCPNSSGQHSLADLGFYGQAQRKGQRMYPAYAIVAGSIHSEGNAQLAQPIDSISAHDLPDFAAEILAIWLEKQWRFASFAEYIDAEGKDDIRAICDRYREIPDFNVDRSYYFDWNSQQLFTIAGRGPGECSAGLFDLIGVGFEADQGGAQAAGGRHLQRRARQLALSNSAQFCACYW